MTQSQTNQVSMFFTYGPQAPTALCNGPSCADLQENWIVEALDYIRKNKYRCIDAVEDASKTWAEGVAIIANMSLPPTACSVSMLESDLQKQSLTQLTVVYGRRHPE